MKCHGVSDAAQPGGNPSRDRGRSIYQQGITYCCADKARGTVKYLGIQGQEEIMVNGTLTLGVFMVKYISTAVKNELGNELGFIDGRWYETWTVVFYGATAIFGSRFTFIFVYRMQFLPME